MTQMDDELRRALRRVDPPAGFSDRVLQASKAQPAAPKPVAAPKALWRAKAGWAVAAALVAAIGSGVWFRVEERRKQEGEEAKRQVLLSLNIAGSKLREVASKINHEQER
jgi:hypothetical protein